MEGLPYIDVTSSSVIQVPVVPQDHTLPVGIAEATDLAVKTYYVSMGAKELE